jgi:Mn2+/Fe2+ NRAMP family transporter
MEGPPPPGGDDPFRGKDALSATQGAATTAASSDVVDVLGVDGGGAAFVLALVMLGLVSGVMTACHGSSVHPCSVNSMRHQLAQHGALPPMLCSPSFPC